MDNSLRLARLLIVFACLIWVPAAQAGSSNGERPGDEFRQAAADYAGQAREAINEAASAQGADVGRHLQLGAIFRQMAGIKRRAAALADHGRWDEINWDRYQELETQRERIKESLLGKSGYAGQHDSSDSGFLAAAREYEARARQAREHAGETGGVARAIFEELSEVFDEMAGIKHEAAAAERSGRDFDWTHYEQLSARRDTLHDMLEIAK